jgi:hypothetical protein
VWQHETRPHRVRRYSACASRATCAPPGAAAHRGTASTQGTARRRRALSAPTGSPLRRGSGCWRPASPSDRRGSTARTCVPHAVREYCPYLPMPCVSAHCNAVEYCHATCRSGSKCAASGRRRAPVPAQMWARGRADGQARPCGETYCVASTSDCASKTCTILVPVCRRTKRHVSNGNFCVGGHSVRALSRTGRRHTLHAARLQPLRRHT